MPAATDGGMTLLASVTSSGGTTMVISGIDTTGYQNFMLTIMNRGFNQGSSDMYIRFNNIAESYGWTNTFITSGVMESSGLSGRSAIEENGQIEGGASGALSNTRIIFGRNGVSSNFKLYGIIDKQQADSGSSRPQGMSLFSAQGMNAAMTSITIGSASNRNFTTGARAHLWGLK